MARTGKSAAIRLKVDLINVLEPPEQQKGAVADGLGAAMRLLEFGVNSANLVEKT